MTIIMTCVSSHLLIAVSQQGQTEKVQKCQYFDENSDGKAPDLCHKIPIIHFSLLFLFLCMQLFNRFFSLFVVFIVVSFKKTSLGC